MKLVLKLEISGHGHIGQEFPASARKAKLDVIQHILSGPLFTGLDAANAQLEAEGKKLRLKLVSTEIHE